MKSFLYYFPVILLLTLFKGYLVIGHLWRKEKHHIREVQLVPFNDFYAGKTIFGSAFNVLGNLALFIPFGILTYVLLRSIRRATLLGFCLSLSLEILQYVFSLGVSDTDDLIYNTLGTFIGAWVVSATGTRCEKWWTWACIAFATLIYVLYLLGPRLGSEDDMTPTARGVDKPAAAQEPVTDATALGSWVDTH